MRLADDPHPNGLTTVWLHPKSGQVLASNRWSDLDVGMRMTSVVFPLHTGELGGVWLEAATFLNGLALGTLGIAGIWLWWCRSNMLQRLLASLATLFTARKRDAKGAAPEQNCPLK